MVPRMTTSATGLLTEMGISPNYLGYNYVFYGLELIESDSDYLYGITKKLYVEIAKKYNCTPASVEKNIRNVISIAFKKGNKETLKSIFQQNTEPPSNQSFFIALYYYLFYSN